MPEELILPYVPIATEGQSVLGFGASNDAVFYVLTQRDRPESEGDDNWTILEFFEHSFKSGAPITPRPIGSFTLDGKVGPSDVFVNAIAVSPSRVLFGVTVTEGKFYEEAFFYHGYLVEGLSMKSKVERVLRIPYDGANVIPSIAIHKGQISIVIGSMVTQFGAESGQIERSIKWPDDSVKYPAFAAWQDFLYALPQVNSVNIPLDNILTYDLGESNHSWKGISPDSRFGYPQIQWHKSWGVYAQSGSRIVMQYGGALWSLDLAEQPFRWVEMTRGKSLHETVGGSDFIFATFDGGMFIVGQEYTPHRLFRLEGY